MVKLGEPFVSRHGGLIATIGDATAAEQRFIAAMSGRGSGSGSDAGSSSPAENPALKQNKDPRNIVYKSKGKTQYRVSPWGVNNLFPNALLEMSYNNNLMPGFFEFKEDMMFGKGVKFVDRNGGEVDTPELRRWLDSWDYEGYVQSQIGDYVILYNIFTQFIKTRDGKGIACLQSVSGEQCRKTVMEKGFSRHILVADWVNTPNEFDVYPVFDPTKPITEQADVTMFHAYRRSPGYNYYGMPRYVGALHYWIPLLNRIPEYHLSMIRNSLNALFHIEIPLDALENMRKAKGWSGEQLEKWVEEKLNDLDEMLCGSSNAGKTFFTYAAKDPNSSTLFTWKITPIDNKAKQLSEGYLKLFNDGNQAITSAMQVQPSLACIQLGDKLSSGSEVLNSYNLHMQTRTQLPRKIVLQALNYALRINFPNLDVHACFDNVLLVHQDKDKTGVEPAPADPTGSVDE